ncbi:MAG: hypothetical protein FRX49_00238 [Trebouxia sp. A1-2]|nr:MAG: hypothetical protein FRX49_00238 [Trebouxia sp. A1-2]
MLRRRALQIPGANQSGKWLVAQRWLAAASATGRPELQLLKPIHLPLTFVPYAVSTQDLEDGGLAAAVVTSGLFRLSFQLQGLTKFHACQYRNAVISCKGSKTSVFVIVVKSNKKVSRTSIEKYGQLEFETLTIEEANAESDVIYCAKCQVIVHRGITCDGDCELLYHEECFGADDSLCEKCAEERKAAEELSDPDETATADGSDKELSDPAETATSDGSDKELSDPAETATADGSDKNSPTLLKLPQQMVQIKNFLILLKLPQQILVHSLLPMQTRTLLKLPQQILVHMK